MDELTWDEVNSLAESNRELLLSDEIDGDEAHAFEFSIVGEDGVWILYDFGVHIVAEQMFDDFDWLRGAATHVGIVEGRCSPLCAGRQRDGELVLTLPQKVRRGGVEWTLEAGDTYGEPQYVSDIGWVNAPPACERGPIQSLWFHGDNDGNESKNTYSTYKLAMDALIEQQRGPTHCSACGHRLRRSTGRRSR